MDDLKLIKRHYGEKMMHLCRELFPTILETPGLLYTILKDKFHPSRFLYEDLVKTNTIDSFKNYIYMLLGDHTEKGNSKNKTPAELLDEAGYILYECKTEKDIQEFRKYYKRPNGVEAPKYIEGTEPVPFDGEELCTFNGGRLGRCFVFFAVKKNVDEIKRENFTNPRRDDEYGTSVISIQFSRGSTNTLSIKNRYNHTVQHPDATFSNNLDNIIPGLTEAFEKEYDLDITGKGENLHIPGYVLANDGKYYKYNCERNNVYYCPDNIIIDNFEVKQYDKSRYLVINLFIIDFKNKTIEAYDRYYSDGFLDQVKNIKSIRVENNKETNDKNIIINDDIIITVNPANQIKCYKNPHVTNLEYGRILVFENGLEEIDFPNLEKIKTSFMDNNLSLKRVNLPKCKSVGSYFLMKNNKIEEINLPECEEIDKYFMYKNESLKKINLPKCKTIECGFLEENNDLKEIELPEVVSIGNNFLQSNMELKRISIPKCTKIGDNFIAYNMKLEEVYAPEVVYINENFLHYNAGLKKLSLPKCMHIAGGFMTNNEILEEIYLPKVLTIDDGFLKMNKNLKEIDLPEVLMIGISFLANNRLIKKFKFPNMGEYDRTGADILKKL